MENASKALIMAGSVLIALLVIGIVSLMYTQLSEIQQTKSDVETTTKAIDYMKRFEQYNRTVYGSELLSLGNLQLDYNYRQADLQGYTPVTITVQIKKAVRENGKTYVSVGVKDLSVIRSGLSSLEEDIAYYEENSNGYQNKKESGKRSVSYYAQLSNRQIATLFEVSYSSGETDYEIGERLANSVQNPRTSKLLQDIELYTNLKAGYTEFKNTSFTCQNIQYDNNARVSTMSFIEN